MIGITLNEWMYKFSPVTFWDKNRPTDLALQQYEYFYIDLLAAWEKSAQVGAREVLEEMKRRWEISATPIYIGEVVCMGEYPENLTVVEVTDSGRMRNGYERMWEEGHFLFNGQKAKEIIWHRHDGYGHEAGSIQVFIYR